MSLHSKVTRYSDEDLKEFKILIEDKLQKAREEFDFIKDQIIELNENSSDQQGGDMGDDSSVYAELDMLNRMAERQQKFIQGLENAHVRVENKTYGICSVTGQLIDKKRLLLVPHATKSIEGKEQEKVMEVEKKLTPVETEEKERKLETKTIPTTPKVITKIVRKPIKKDNKPILDDDFEKEWDEIVDDLEGIEDYDNSVIGMNLDDIADDDPEPTSNNNNDSEDW